MRDLEYLYYAHYANVTFHTCTEQEAIDYINGLGDKLVAQLGTDEVIDAR